MAWSGKRWALFLLLSAPRAAAQEAATPAPVAAPTLPPALVMPFRTLGIDAEELARARQGLEQSMVGLANGFLQAPRPLSQLQPQSPRLTINFRRRSDKILTGTPKAPAAAIPSAAIEASWCSIMDHHVFFVTVASANGNVLLGSRHVEVARQEWERIEGSQGQAAFLNSKLPGLLQGAWSDAQARAAKPRTDNLNVGLSQSEDSTRRDEGSGFCTAQLLEEKLAPDYTVARSLGSDYLSMAHDLFELPPKLTRATRGVLLSFRQPKQLEPKRTLPVTLDLTTRFLETVFGQHLRVEPKTSPVQLAAAGGQITLTGIDGVKKALDAEKATLLLADAPQAAKIDRAWVYVDRGRAYGLKMNDRVVAEVDGKPVKGHVVKFFGPELNLLSPRGFPIHEGAIIFIRKGQRLTKVGMAFKTDDRQYPTPYPIKPTGK